MRSVSNYIPFLNHNKKNFRGNFCFQKYFINLRKFLGEFAFFMSNESVNLNRSSLASELGGSLAMSGVMTGGFGSLSAIKRGKGIKGAIEATRLNNETVNKFLKNVSADADSFTKSYAVAKNYEALTSAQKSAQKAKKAIDKINNNGGSATLWQRIKNLGKSSEEITAKYAENAKDASENLRKITQGLDAGVDVSGVMAKSLKQNAGSLFKEELLNPLNLLITGMSAVGRIKDEALPAFKNEGFVAGVKKTVTVAAKTVADVFSNAGFSAAFRIAGSRIGMFFGPAGAAVGGLVGDIIGSFFSNKLIVKLFGEDKIAQNDAAAQNSTQTARDLQTADAMDVEPGQQYSTAGVSNPQTVAVRPKSGYIKPQNGVYATEWVNSGIKNGNLHEEARLRRYV